MNKTGKILCLFAVIILLIAMPVFSEVGLGDLKEKVNDFTDALAQSLPFNSARGLNWSDAYIGQLFALPPHFGIGVNAGFTTMNFGSLNGLLNMFHVPLPEKVNIGGFSLPGYTIDARIGGFILPFDIGVKFGYLHFTPDFINGLLKTDIPDFTMDYLLVGADIRYALIKGKTFPFKLSVGGGFNYLKGGMAMPVPGTADLSFSVPTGTDTLTLNIPKPVLGLNWETKALDFKAQASIKILVITPYVGVGASYAWSNAGYGVKSKINVTDEQGQQVDLSSAKDKLEGFGISGINENGFSQINEVTGWSFRGFGGLSINLSFIKLDLTGMYDFLSECYGFTFGIRLQI
ncbi:hypothetical protein R84B8_03233 [Treponema sp. R8-4-B8]